MAMLDHSRFSTSEGARNYAARVGIDEWIDRLPLVDLERRPDGGWRGMATWSATKYVWPTARHEEIAATIYRLHDEALRAGNHDRAAHFNAKLELWQADHLVPWPDSLPHFVEIDGCGSILCDGMDRHEWEPLDFIALANGYKTPSGDPDLFQAWDFARGAEVLPKTGETKAAVHRDLGMVSFDDDAPNLDDANLIEGVIPDEGLGAMFGKPGCGKTFVALDLAFAIAGAADKWRDKYVEHGAVMYFGMEGGRKFANRIHAYKMERGRAPYFYRSNANLNLRSNQQDAEAVIAEAKKIAAVGVPVRMIVVDTLSRALAGGNENGPEDMGAFVAICEHIRKAVGCFLLVVHHSGKDEARGMRGHTSLLGAVDTELELKAGDGGRLMTVTKQRDDEDGEQFGYMLRSVLIGSSKTRGKPITSCVVEPTEAKAAAPRLGSAQRVALEALRQFIEDEGKACPSGTGWPEAGSRRIVAIADFLQFLSDKLTNDKADDRRRSAKRCFDALIEKGLVQTNEGSAWIV